MTYSACELLSRSFPVCIFPTDPHSRTLPFVSLPNGRSIPVCHDFTPIKVWFFADVLWNGASDINYHTFHSGLRIAQIVFDSDEFPHEWVSILNQRFDVALVTSTYMLDVAKRSGVEIPVALLPIGLDIEGLLARPFLDATPNQLSFLSLSAFHPRKEHEAVIQAFHRTFGGSDEVRLHIHSNLSFLDTFDRLQRLVNNLKANNITLTCGDIPANETHTLLENCDVYVNCSRGEGFSIGVREALALGKTSIVSRTGAHLDLDGPAGIFNVAAVTRCPARYPEIDNRVIGSQFRPQVDDIGASLLAATEFVRSGDASRSRSERRRFAAQVSFTALTTAYANVLNGSAARLHPRLTSNEGGTFPSTARAAIDRKISRFGAGLSFKRNRVVQAHDGGYFSLFNCFFSNLIWNRADQRNGWTLPDWDATRFLARHQGKQIESFCYGASSDGNFWTKLYRPLFGFSEAEMNDPDCLYENATVEDPPFNGHREPLLTHVNAYQLYRSADFARWRHWYHSAYREHIQLDPALAAEIDRFTVTHFSGKFMIAVHVRHPSHSIEQPGGSIAATKVYIDLVNEQAAAHGFRNSDDSWGIFLATDQDAVVKQFTDIFGPRVSFFNEVRRTREQEDSRYSAGDLAAQGHQVQHIVASDQSNWSTRMAIEVVRDATTMSRCNLLIHIVSNVSTAISYMNPNLKLVLAHPKAN